MYNAFAKYGFENFQWSVLHKNVPLENLNDLEDSCIDEYDTLSPNGYNLKKNYNNEKVIFSETTIKKMSESQKNVYKNGGYKNYRRDHGMSKGLPQYVTYIWNKQTKSHNFKLQGHPLCEEKSFMIEADSRQDISKLNQLKEKVLNFISKLEESQNSYERPKQMRKRLNLVKGVTPVRKTPGAYKCWIVKKGKRYNKQFGSEGSEELNRLAANAWVIAKRKEIENM